MSLSMHKARLTGATRELMLRWETTRESWRDARSLEFEKQYIEELRAGVDKASVVLDQLDKLVAKIRSDCE